MISMTVFTDIRLALITEETKTPAKDFSLNTFILKRRVLYFDYVLLMIPYLRVKLTVGFYRILIF